MKYLTANFNKNFALVWDNFNLDWVNIHDFSTDSLLKHGLPSNLIWSNWNNFNYPTKTFQDRVYVWAHAKGQGLVNSRFFFYDSK